MPIALQVFDESLSAMYSFGPEASAKDLNAVLRSHRNFLRGNQRNKLERGIKKGGEPFAGLQRALDGLAPFGEQLHEFRSVLLIRELIQTWSHQA